MLHFYIRLDKSQRFLTVDALEWNAIFFMSKKLYRTSFKLFFFPLSMIYFSRHTKHVLTRRSWRTEWVDSSRGEKKRREKWDPGACFSLFACVSWSIYSWLLKFSTDLNPFWAHRHSRVQSTHFVTITLATLCFNCPGNSLRSLIRMRDEADGSRWWWFSVHLSNWNLRRFFPSRTIRSIFRGNDDAAEKQGLSGVLDRTKGMIKITFHFVTPKLLRNPSIKVAKTKAGRWNMPLVEVSCSSTHAHTRDTSWTKKFLFLSRAGSSFYWRSRWTAFADLASR